MPSWGQKNATNTFFPQGVGVKTETTHYLPWIHSTVTCYIMCKILSMYLTTLIQLNTQVQKKGQIKSSSFTFPMLLWPTITVSVSGTNFWSSAEVFTWQNLKAKKPGRVCYHLNSVHEKTHFFFPRKHSESYTVLYAWAFTLHAHTISTHFELSWNEFAEKNATFTFINLMLLCP